jgi:arginase
MRALAVIGVPTSAGAHAAGQEKAPAAFRAAGIVDLLERRGYAVNDLGDLARVRWTPDPRNPRAQRAEQVATVAGEVATAVAAACGGADAVLVLGGDCTIEVGVVSGFIAAGRRVGLVYLDAGPDLNVPTSVRHGFLDWMGTAHLLGLPEATYSLSHLGPRFPLLDRTEVVFAGVVPDELTEWEREVLARDGLRVISSEDVAENPRQAARDAIAALARPDVILLHFDLDVVDFTDFPAADFATINAGITLAAALAFVAEIAADPAFGALTVCEFNPDHVDEEQRLVRTFVEQLVTTLPSPQSGPRSGDPLTG